MAIDKFYFLVVEWSSVQPQKVETPQFLIHLFGLFFNEFFIKLFLIRMNVAYYVFSLAEELSLLLCESSQLLLGGTWLDLSIHVLGKIWISLGFDFVLLNLIQASFIWPSSLQVEFLLFEKSQGSSTALEINLLLKVVVQLN